MRALADRLALDGGEPVRRQPYPRGRGIELIGAEEMRLVHEVLAERALFRYCPGSLGRVDRAEAALRERFQVGYAVAVSSGTAALYAGLTALNIGEGDEVVVPAVTFIATVNAVVMARAVPVFAEVDESLTLDPESVRANLTPRCRAIIPVHLDNVAADMAPLLDIARAHDLLVLEDAAQAAGVSYRGRPVGAFGDAAALSFQQGKNITCGEGGALLTSDWAVHDAAVRFQDQGGQFTTSTGSRERASGTPIMGMNLRMTELAASVLLAQLGRLDQIVETCRARARRIRQALADLPVAWRRIPDEAGEGGSVILYLDSPQRANHFAQALAAEGIPAGQMYGGQPVYANPAVLAQQTAWPGGSPFNRPPDNTGRRYRLGLCPRSEDLFGRAVVVGVSPVMTERDEEQAVQAIRKVARCLL